MINPCCCSCILFTDDFSASLAAEWEQVAGTWSTSGGLLTTSNTDAMIAHETEVPNNKGIIRSTISSITADPATAGYRLIAFIDEDNYAYIEIKANVSFGVDLQLGYFSGGSETVLDTATGLSVGNGAIDEITYVRLCWDGVRLVGGYQNATLSGDYTAPDNLRPGFATPSSGTDWEFGDIELAYHNEERSNCPGCKTCWDICETFPATLEVEIPAATFSSRAFAGDNWFCNGNCENLNGQTYVLTLDPDGDVDVDDSPSTGKTACPLYVYEEEEFCDVENPSDVGSFPATLRIVARFRANSAGRGIVDVFVNISSACVSGVSGNRTVFQFSGFVDPPDPPLPTWGDCLDEDYDTLPENNAGFGGGGTVLCHGNAPASGVSNCIVNSNVLTIHL